MCETLYMLAPYVDTTAYPILELETVSGLDAVSLAFIVADSNGNPSWGGAHSIDSDYFKKQIDFCKRKNIEMICSFGGAAGKELALVIKDSQKLFEAYHKVAKRYDFKYLDFDIEGSALDNKEANQRRAEAINILKSKGFHISLTVPVNPSGLDSKVVELVNQTPCDLVNIMAMDYGSINDMGEAAITATKATHKQTGKNIGITVMIGKNDTKEIFTLDDARKVAKFAHGEKYVKRLSYWSLHRDQGKQGSLDKSSQVKQAPWEFLSLLK